MASVDAAIVNVGGPSIQRELSLSAAGLELTIYAYVVVYAVSLILGARLGARYGFGQLFVWGTLLFTASSLACGLAVNPAMLVGARATQGLGAALLVPQVLSLLQTSFDADRRERLLGLYGLVLAGGVAAGQVLGGVLITTDLFGIGWRSIFLVNVPIGVAILAYSAGRLPASAGNGPRRLDLVGATMLAALVLATVVPLTFGTDAGWPWWCWTLVAAAACALVALGVYERRLTRRKAEPLIDTSLLARREVGCSLAAIFALMAGYGGLLFIIGFHLQNTLHESALSSGLTFAAYATGFATASLTWFRLPTAWHGRIPAAGFGLIVVATGALAWLSMGGGWPPLATFFLALAGAGHGAGFGALVQRLAGSVTTEQAAFVSGMVSTISQLAIVTGIAVAGTLYVAAGPGAPIPGMSLVLLIIATVQASTCTTMSILLRQSPDACQRQSVAPRGSLAHERLVS